ncbi:hypothetical protein D3C85_1885170 [compost metagenome]
MQQQVGQRSLVLLNVGSTVLLEHITAVGRDVVGVKGYAKLHKQRLTHQALGINL